MTYRTNRISSIVLAGLAVAALTACSSKPKPGPLASPAAQQSAPPAPSGRPNPAPVNSSRLDGPVPGSTQDFLISAGDRVYFDFDAYTLRPDAKPVLDAQAAWLVRYPQVTVRIEGNADERGTVDYNFALGARRANAVKQYLLSRGVAQNRIETVSYGKSRPIDPRQTEEGWAINRNSHTAILSGAR